MKPKGTDPDFIVEIAFGKPTEPAVGRAYEFKRKSLDEMSRGADLRFEAARLAPSGMNSQPWYYIVDGNKIHTHHKPSLEGILGKIYNLTDLAIGISLCHLATAGGHEGRPLRFAMYQGGTPTPPNGSVYMGTVE